MLQRWILFPAVLLRHLLPWLLAVNCKDQACNPRLPLKAHPFVLLYLSAVMRAVAVLPQVEQPGFPAESVCRQAAVVAPSSRKGALVAA